MEFKWLSELDRESKLFDEAVNFLATLNPEWSKEKILHLLDNSHDCLLGFSGKKIATLWAVNKDRAVGIMKGFLIYTALEFTGKGFAKQITAELAKRAKKEGFKHAQLGLGNNDNTAAVLQATHRDRESLGVAGFHFDHKTGKVTFPKRV